MTLSSVTRIHLILSDQNYRASGTKGEPILNTELWVSYEDYLAAWSLLKLIQPFRQLFDAFDHFRTIRIQKTITYRVANRCQCFTSVKSHIG